MHRDFPRDGGLAAGAPLPARQVVAPPPKGPAAATLRLIACLLAGGLAHLALWQFSEPPTLFSDFYKAYFPAGEVLWEDGFAASFPFNESGAGGFVNVPVLGWLFVPFVPFGEEAAGWAFLAAGAAATVVAYLLLRRLARPGAEAAPLALLFLLNGPLINTLREGNTTHFVLLLLILALALLRGGSDFAAGLLLGLCAVFKLPLLLFGAYFALRRRWRVVAGGASAVAGVLALSVAAFGLANNLNWFDCCVVPFLGGIIPAFNVQSIDGFAVRLVTGTSRLWNWDPMEVPLAYRLVRQMVFIAIVGYAALTVLRGGGAAPSAGRYGTSRPSDLLEFALVLVLALVLSPISWSHYYALLILPFGLYFGGLLPWPTDATSRGLFWSALVLTSLPIVSLPLEANPFGEIAARTLVSATLAGGIAMLVLLLRQLRHGDARSPIPLAGAATP